ncbi:glycoside hydrolase family 20 zincin-like fold domain-containing protein [Streptomyces sp. NPDC051940]|uniref:beta-N-acetylhexosaminidase n=1 Tax=Streptomyces sp. NPDC051940 TaxID=3155675 RepID=UPI00341958E4
MYTDLTLVPRPQQIEILGASALPLTAAVRETRTEGLPAQGFEIDITADGAELRHGDEAGLRYGRALLEQIRRQAQEQDTWPGLRVRDWPDFPVRGYMLDVSRSRVPTRETLERIVGLLDLLRINQLQLYTEHTFAYQDHEPVWRHASPLTADDVRWLDGLCAAQGIELVANQNTFGHMERWLAHEPYRSRAELPDGFELFGAHRGASTLAPTEDNADFALGLVRELLPHFTSRRVNIGCDETWELGRGVSAPDAAERGKGRVYADHLRRLLTPLLEEGYEPQFWGDIIAHYPELVGELPAGATAVAWDYEAPSARDAWGAWPQAVHDRLAAVGHGVDGLAPGFAAVAAPFAEAGYPFWVAPGTSTWNTLTGRIDNARDNLLDAALVGREHGAGGYLITDWGDNGHLQPPSVSFPPLVYGAAVAWSADANRDLALSPVLDRFVFADPTGRLSAALDTLGHAWRRTGRQSFNASPLAAAVVPGSYLLGEGLDADQLTALVPDLDAALADIAAATPGSPDGALVRRELTAAARLVRHGAWRLLREAGAPAAPDDKALAADLAEATELHRAAWLERSRPGGLEAGLASLERTAAEYGQG